MKATCFLHNPRWWHLLWGCPLDDRTMSTINRKKLRTRRSPWINGEANVDCLQHSSFFSGSHFSVNQVSSQSLCQKSGLSSTDAFWKTQVQTWKNSNTSSKRNTTLTHMSFFFFKSYFNYINYEKKYPNQLWCQMAVISCLSIKTIDCGLSFSVTLRTDDNGEQKKTSCPQNEGAFVSFYY